MHKFLLLLLFPITAYGQGIPTYTSGAVHEVGGDIITDAEDAAIEQKITAYTARTGNEIGVVLVDDATDFTRTFEQFIAELSEKNYTPNGLLLVADIKNRSLSIQSVAAWERSDLWSNVIAEDLSEENLYPNFAAGDYAEGVSNFIDAVAKQVPQSIAAAQENVTQKEVTREAVKGEVTRRTWILSLIFGAILLGIYAGLRAIQKWRKHIHTNTAERFYNDLLPLFTADLETMQPSSQMGKEVQSEYFGLLGTMQTELEHWFEQSEKTYTEARKFADLSEKIENELTSFVNDPASALNKVSSLMAEKDKLERELDAIHKTLDL